MQMFWKLEDMNDRSKSTWQAKIQFACIDRCSGKITDKLFQNIITACLVLLKIIKHIYTGAANHLYYAY